MKPYRILLGAPMSDIYDPKTMQPCSSIGYLIGRVRVALLDATDQELAPLDITTPQFSVMVQLVSNQVDSASMLCKGLSYDPGAMTRMIDRREAKGFVRECAAVRIVAR